MNHCNAQAQKKSHRAEWNTRVGDALIGNNPYQEIPMFSAMDYVAALCVIAMNLGPLVVIAANA